MADHHDEEQLAKLRQSMDALNLRLCDLLAERTQLAREIAQVKRSLGRPIHDPVRERTQLHAIKDEGKDPRNAEALERIFRVILEESRRSLM